MDFRRKLHLYGIMFFGINRRKYLQLPDKELIDLYLQEECAYTLPILYERYGHLVMGSCLKYLRQQQDAEDVTMKIFGELEAKLRKHEIVYFKSWLYQVTRNECLQFLRKKRPADSVSMDQLSQPFAFPDEDSHDPEADLQLLEKAITHLRDEQKRCIELFYLEQFSYTEISEQLSIPLNSVKSAIQNGKRNLKIWMERHTNNEL